MTFPIGADEAFRELLNALPHETSLPGPLGGAFVKKKDGSWKLEFNSDSVANFLREEFGDRDALEEISDITYARQTYHLCDRVSTVEEVLEKDEKERRTDHEKRLRAKEWPKLYESNLRLLKSLKPWRRVATDDGSYKKTLYGTFEKVGLDNHTVNAEDLASLRFSVLGEDSD